MWHRIEAGWCLQGCNALLGRKIITGCMCGGSRKTSADKDHVFAEHFLVFTSVIDRPARSCRSGPGTRLAPRYYSIYCQFQTVLPAMYGSHGWVVLPDDGGCAREAIVACARGVPRLQAPSTSRRAALRVQAEGVAGRCGGAAGQIMARRCDRGVISAPAQGLGRSCGGRAMASSRAPLALLYARHDRS